jgi:hypothetical protein
VDMEKRRQKSQKNKKVRKGMCVYMGGPCILQPMFGSCLLGLRQIYLCFKFPMIFVFFPSINNDSSNCL